MTSASFMYALDIWIVLEIKDTQDFGGEISWKATTWKSKWDVKGSVIFQLMLRKCVLY